MSTKSKKKYLPLFLNPVDTSERHYQLFGSVNTRADTKVVFSEFLKKKVFQEDLNAIAKYVAIKDPYSLSASQFRRIPETETDKFPIKVFELAIAQEEVNSEDPVTINYRKALEPKVSLPFKPRVGTTTRKIELERRKRLYSSLDIEKLIDQELDGLKAKGLLNPNVSQFPNFRGTQVEISATEEVSVYQETDYTLCLPLNLFDDTEFDPRTVDDWLDMGALPDGDVNPHFKGNYRFHKRGYSKPGYPDIRFATIPLPAKAFDGNKWRNCIVIAYDEKIGDWKVKWRNYNGWELDKPLAKGEVFTHSEDINLVTEIKESSGNPRAIDEGREAWVYRYRSSLFCRINLMFLAEDPTNFSKRVANAYYLRHQAVLYIVFYF